MKKHAFLLLLCFVTGFSFGQEKEDYPFDELSISINKTALQEEGTGNKMGFGLGLYKNFRQDERVTMRIGLEYNKTRQFKDHTYEGRFAGGTDWTYNLNHISLPVLMPIYLGNNKRFIFEPGVFVDLNAGSRRRGFYSSFSPIDGTWTRRVSKQAASIPAFNYGFSLGFGINIPLSNFDLVIMPKYKFGMRDLGNTFNELRNRYFRLALCIRMKN